MFFLFGFALLLLSEAVVRDQRLVSPVCSLAPKALGTGRYGAC